MSWQLFPLLLWSLWCYLLPKSSENTLPLSSGLNFHKANADVSIVSWSSYLLLMVWPLCTVKGQVLVPLPPCWYPWAPEILMAPLLFNICSNKKHRKDMLTKNADSYHNLNLGNIYWMQNTRHCANCWEWKDELQIKHVGRLSKLKELNNG